MYVPLVLAAYASLVGLTLWASWRNETIQAVGWALAVSWIASNLAHFYIPVADQPQAYTVCETAVLSMAFFSHVLGAGRCMIALVAVSVVSICCNFYVSTFGTLTRDQTYAWELATNLCFIAENLLVSVPMLYERLRGPRRGVADGGARVALHGQTTGTGR